MKIYRHQIKADIYLQINEDLSYVKDDFLNTYPLLGIKKAHVEGEVYEEEGLLTVNLKVTATCVVADARTNKPFDKKMEVEEEVNLLKNISEEGDGYIFPDDEIDLREVVKCMLVSALPINPMAENSSLPKGGKDYVITTDEDASTSKEGEYDPRFDILDGYEP